MKNIKFKCLHISDIHFRGLTRHKEYKIVFEKLFIKAKELKPNIIFIGGDIVHSKTQGISPELIDILTWWFNSLSAIAPTHVILGNHDGLMLNENRQDAISPIINALDNNNIFLYKKSGTYSTGIKGFNWCVFSCFDEEGWKDVEPVEEEVNIACFHGGVLGSLTDTDWHIKGEVSLSFFNNFDFGFLGDIHKLQYLDDEKRVAYPGSTIQQNYGEDIEKGFLYWEINSRYDYNSEFFSLENPFPYITIDWKDNIKSTVSSLRDLTENSKIRIRYKDNISQSEIKLLHEYLKSEKNAKEIVYQNLGIKNKAEEDNVVEETIIDIKSDTDRISLLKAYFKEEDEKLISEIDNVYREHLDKVSTDYSIYNSNKWSIKSLNFDNTFGYGKNNYIDFDALNGVVGIFGNNRCGKSSIPGTLMYGLFNTTDRGPIKNEYIVNSRKGSCKAKIKFTTSDKEYEILRETTKKTSKSNKISTSTSLSLINNSGEELKNKTEEQRRETEKVLKGIIGSHEEFLCTTFASQGEINSFIKEKTTARKKILSKFLNLDIYEELHKLSRDEYVVIKSKLKELNEKQWQIIVADEKSKIINLNMKNKELESNILEIRSIELEKKIALDKINNSTDKDLVSQVKTEKDILLLKKKNENLNTNLEENNKKLEKFKSKLDKIRIFKEGFPLKKLENDKEKLDILSNNLVNLKNKLSNIKLKEKNANNQIRILSEVPCGDKFKNCMFIKEAHKSKDNIPEIKTATKNLQATVLEVQEIIKKLNKEEIGSKLKKYNELLNKEYALDIDIKSIEKEIINDKKNKKLNVDLIKDKSLLLESISTSDNDSLIKDIEKLKTELKEISRNINNCEIQKQKNLKDTFRIESNIENLEAEEEAYEELINKWQVLDLFSRSLSKKDGIPTMLINSSLPKINKEIKNILSGVCNFDIELINEKSGNLNIYIDYGDSKRIIECCSGMEKMISSIAIRVALINISNLPKSDMFIIDEGFGSLDNTNIEACGRLLKSLKKYFKTILIISHIDTIKDIVDKNLEITLKGKDSHVRFE
jgi:DNA repair exonuclease SbcCD ATPase subunit